MLTLTDSTEKDNWDSYMQRYGRGKEYPPELDNMVIDLARNPNMSLKNIKDFVPCRSGYVDAVLWRARRRGIL